MSKLLQKVKCWFGYHAWRKMRYTDSHYCKPCGLLTEQHEYGTHHYRFEKEQKHEQD